MRRRYPVFPMTKPTPFRRSGLMGGFRLSTPSRYMGLSQRNAHAGISRSDVGLETKIISVDPHPRAEIDLLC
jgi:hypothetical protein